VQPLTYGNIQTSDSADDDARCHGDGTVYANIQQSPESAADQFQFNGVDASQHVVYSELHSN